MTAEPTQWALDPDVWSELCDAVEPGTAVDRPYDRIPVGQTPEGDLEAYVEEPWPDPPDDSPMVETDDDGNIIEAKEWEAGPDNDIQTLPPELEEPIWEKINAMRDAGFTIADDAPEFNVSIERAVFTPEKGVGVFKLERELSDDEEGLYTQMRELMVTLDHVDNPENVVSGNRLAPRTSSTLSDHAVDLGVGATVYRLVENPHEYWANCETLDDYIDMCVENGADREALEAKDEYHHHFHPHTEITNLTDTQEQAVVDWQDTLTAAIRPHLEIGTDTRRHYVGDAWFDDDGTGSVVYTVIVGDEINRND